MIATSLAGKKKDDFLNGGKGANLKIVRPQWVMVRKKKGMMWKFRVDTIPQVALWIWKN